MLALALLTACGSSENPAAPDVPASDVAPDMALADAPVPDVMADAAVDVQESDAGFDAAPDVVPDVTTGDVVSDVARDATPDAAPRSFLAAYPIAGRFPEGGTYDPSSHRFFVGSLDDGSVRAIHATTGAESVMFRETAAGRWWTLGMDVDVARRRLAVCAMDDRRAVAGTDHPYDGYVWVFDLDTGARVARRALSAAFATATCTDVAWAADGSLYVCDRESPRIYRIDPGGALSVFVNNSLLSGATVGQNALVVLPDQSALLSLIYLPSRLVRVSLRDRSVANVSLRGTFFDGLPLLSGADGMTLSGDALLVAFTSQVTRVTPTLADWSAASTATVDVPEGMTDIVHTPGGDYLLNGQAVRFVLGQSTDPFRLVRFVGMF
jgi:sugar lactone lactonase YvrE